MKELEQKSSKLRRRLTGHSCATGLTCRPDEKWDGGQVSRSQPRLNKWVEAWFLLVPLGLRPDTLIGHHLCFHTHWSPLVFSVFFHVYFIEEEELITLS